MDTDENDPFIIALKRPWIPLPSTEFHVDSDVAEIPIQPTPLKVAWICSWTDGQTLMQQHLKWMSQDGVSGTWMCPSQCSLLKTVPLADADYVVVLDDLPSNPPPLEGKKLIYIQREPSAIRTLPDLSGYHAVATLQSLGYHVATPWIQRPLPDLLKMDWPVKTGQLVAVCSGKTFTPDQQWRLEFIKALCQAGIDIDVYGRGLDAKDFNGHYKGYTSGNDKSALLLPYRFCLALENSSEPGYFTEKVVDPLLMFTIPIYWGCPNIVDFLPNHCLLALNRKQPLPVLVDTVKKVIQAEIPLETQLGVTEARRRILLDYNLWPTVHKLLCRCSQ